MRCNQRARNVVLGFLSLPAVMLQVACTTSELGVFPQAMMDVAAAAVGIHRPPKPLDTGPIPTRNVGAQPTPSTTPERLAGPANPTSAAASRTRDPASGTAAITVFSPAELTKASYALSKGLSAALGQTVHVKQVSGASMKGGLETIEGGPGDGRTLLLASEDEVFSAIDSGLVDNNQIAILTKLPAADETILVMAPRSTTQETAMKLIAAVDKLRESPEMRDALNGGSEKATAPASAVPRPTSVGGSAAPASPQARGSAIPAAAAAPTSGAGEGSFRAGASSCPANLNHLAKILPQYGDAELDNLRRQMVSTETTPRLRDVMAKQNLTARQLANLYLKQAEEFERGFPNVEQCIRASSNKPDAIIGALRAGTYDLRGRHDGVSGSCTRAYVAYYYGWVYHREMALVASCMAK